MYTGLTSDRVFFWTYEGHHLPQSTSHISCSIRIPVGIYPYLCRNERSSSSRSEHEDGLSGRSSCRLKSHSHWSEEQNKTDFIDSIFPIIEFHSSYGECNYDCLDFHHQRILFRLLFHGLHLRTLAFIW